MNLSVRTALWPDGLSYLAEAIIYNDPVVSSLQPRHLQRFRAACYIILLFGYQVKQLIQMDNLNERNSEPSKQLNALKVMMQEIGDNTKALFMAPILQFTLISISINLTFHIG